ncbi:hypothetical protein ACIQKB_04000 [Streptomyces sp. NPDC092046]|uniref:hypothetical protein n=1 Tax=Streptomyces sp. NPDC092046 TaxID=3366009 RepID=UPI00382450E1
MTWWQWSLAVLVALAAWTANGALVWDPLTRRHKHQEFAVEMTLDSLMRDYTNGDQTSWPEEFAWIKANHPRRLARITREVQAGHFPPVRLDFEEKRVIDGHHRITAAADLGLAHVPVADAWGTDQEWWLFASDSGADDPEPAR